MKFYLNSGGFLMNKDETTDELYICPLTFGAALDKESGVDLDNIQETLTSVPVYWKTKYSKNWFTTFWMTFDGYKVPDDIMEVDAFILASNLRELYELY